MKKSLILHSMLFVCIIGGSLLFAQNILDVPAEDGQGVLLVNSLITYVVADTNAAGEQLHDAYRLERGKTYLYNQAPVFKNPITLFADEPGTTAETRPPKIMVTVDDAGAVPYAHCIETFADLTVRNIAFSTTSMDGVYSWANAILLNTDGLRIVLEGCHFTLTGWGIIEANVDNSVFIVDNCHIRNATVYDYGDEWCPFFFEINSGSADTLIARNNTWFNLQGSVVNIEQQNFVRYFYFDHNTLVNVVKGFTALTAHLESIVTNNIFYNVDPHSITLVEQAAAEDEVPRSVIMADTLLSNEPGSTLDHVMAENERKYTVSNNCYYFSQGVQDYWTAHAADVVPLDWMNTVTQAMFDDDAGYPHFIAEDNVNVDPGFTNFGGTDGMVANMTKHRAGNGFGFWGWDPDSVDYAAPLHWAVLQWPLPEDFSHSANIIGNDGFHIGSLEYYPDELIAYKSTLSINEPGVTSVPNNFSLRQNYPNPFNPVTIIDYELNVMDNVKLVIYNMLGQEVKTLVNRSNISAGSYSVNWDGIDNMGQKVSDGVYLYKLQVGENLITKKMVLLK